MLENSADPIRIRRYARKDSARQRNFLFSGDRHVSRSETEAACRQNPDARQNSAELLTRLGVRTRGSESGMRSNNRGECSVIRQEAFGRLLNRRRERQQGRSQNGTLALTNRTLSMIRLKRRSTWFAMTLRRTQLFGFPDFNFAEASLRDPIGESFDIPMIPKLCS